MVSGIPGYSPSGQGHLPRQFCVSSFVVVAAAVVFLWGLEPGVFDDAVWMFLFLFLLRQRLV